ncbi:hypothetical protein HBO14_11080 [Pseudomonas sp. WS 5406]|uniref:hypothetical protein n=1 Tax=Pseudomonas sp. WS 5406 TaxID=2717498 RepID=UPI00147360E9|nr:hypothetical protein [Pseudomonas sp. WS 5406]NMX27068.1 hypothetical protein [Pseudomonas sp. WS 5406]
MTNQTIDGVPREIRDLLERVATEANHMLGFTYASNYDECRKAVDDLRALLDAPAENVIDVSATDWAAIQEAASESTWMPHEYMRNDWVADVCRFLRDGAAAQLGADGFYQLIEDIDLKKIQEFLGDGDLPTKSFFLRPDAAYLANVSMHLVREVQALRIKLAAHPQGEPVAYLDLEKIQPGGMAYATKMRVNHRQTALYAEQPAPVAVYEEFEFAKWTHEVIEESRIGGVTIKIQRMQHLTPGEEKSAHDAWMARAALSTKSQ